MRITRTQFEELVKKFHRPMVTYCRTRAHDLSSAEEMVQQTWYRVWRDESEGRGKGFDPTQGSFFTYVVNRYMKFGPPRARQFDSTNIAQLPAVNEKSPADALVLRENAERRLAAFRELFRLLFLCGGYPHEQLAFAWSKHIYANSAGAGRGAPKRFDSEQVAKPLTQMTDDYWEAYQSRASLGRAEIATLCGFLDPMKNRLRLSVDHLFATRSNVLRALDELAQKPVGSLCMHTFVTTNMDLAESISDWCAKVREKVIACLGMDETDEIGSLAADPHTGPPSGCSRRRCKLSHSCPEFGAARQSHPGSKAANIFTSSPPDLEVGDVNRQ